MIFNLIVIHSHKRCHCCQLYLKNPKINWPLLIISSRNKYLTSFFKSFFNTLYESISFTYFSDMVRRVHGNFERYDQLLTIFGTPLLPILPFDDSSVYMVRRSLFLPRRSYEQNRLCGI